MQQTSTNTETVYIKVKLTVHDPIPFALLVLAQGCQLQTLLAVWVTRWWGYNRDLSFFVLVMDDTPCSVNNGLDLMTMTKLQFHELPQYFELWQERTW